MKNLRIENNLSDTDFSFRKKGDYWTVLSANSSSPITLSKNDRYFYKIKGDPVNNNSIFWGIKNCTHCLEIIDIAPETNLYYALYRFTPIVPITGNDDIVVKAKKAGVTAIGTHSGNCDVEFINKLNKNCFINLKTTTNPAIQPLLIYAVSDPPDPTKPNIKIYTFPNTDTFEFYITMVPGESGRFSVKLTIKDFQYTIRKFRMNKTEVSLTYEDVSPANINITIEPD